MLYPTELWRYPFVAGVYLCSALSHVSTVLLLISKSGGEWREGTWHRSSPCPEYPGCKRNSWHRGQVSLSAGNLWVLPSSPHLLPKKSPSQVAADCNRDSRKWRRAEEIPAHIAAGELSAGTFFL